MAKSHPQKLQDAMLKIMKWTCRAEDALTRKKALKALRKVAKWSQKLALLQSEGYTQGVPQKETTYAEHPGSNPRHS